MQPTPLADPDVHLSTDAVMERFRTAVYGHAPTRGWELDWRLLAEHATPTGGRRQQWILTLGTNRGTAHLVLLVDLPPGDQQVPAFLGLNFRGNHACTPDPHVVNVSEEPPGRAGHLYYQGLREPVTLPVSRALTAHRWPTNLISGRGYALVTACYLQCGPDSPEIFAHGVHRLFSMSTAENRAADEWGSLSIWAWLLSRILDALSAPMVPRIDHSRVAVMGHSRLGKAALWAAAQDPRFAMTISNNSGCMGAAVSRTVGETPTLLAEVRPQWFARNFAAIASAGTPLPVDQYQLIAAIAPRSVYVASASDDAPADPEGELLSLRLASRAWGLDARTDLPSTLEPDTVHHCERVPLGYHVRRGGHEVMPWDWVQWLDFADRWL